MTQTDKFERSTQIRNNTADFLRKYRPTQWILIVLGVLVLFSSGYDTFIGNPAQDKKIESTRASLCAAIKVNQESCNSTLDRLALIATDGQNGKNGKPGLNANPFNGKDGKSGSDGKNGTSGTDGIDGSAGTNGLDGLQGPRGATGATGPGPSDAQIAGAVSSYCAAHNDCQGPQGEKGATGDTGLTGPIGPQGPVGNVICNVVDLVVHCNPQS